MPSSLRACRSRFCLLSQGIGRTPNEGLPPRNGGHIVGPNDMLTRRGWVWHWVRYYAGLLLALFLARVVGGVDIVDVERPNAVRLDDRLPLGHRVMAHALGQ